MPIHTGRSPVACFAFLIFVVLQNHRSSVSSFFHYLNLKQRNDAELRDEHALGGAFTPASTQTAAPCQMARNGIEWLSAFRVSPARSHLSVLENESGITN